MPRAEVFELLDARHGPLTSWQLTGALGALAGHYIRAFASETHTALRNGRGEVVLLFGREEAFRQTNLDLGPQGRLAGPVLLLDRHNTRLMPRATHKLDVPDELPHCITVSGACIDAWHPSTGVRLWTTSVSRVRFFGERTHLTVKLLGAPGRLFLAAWGQGCAATTLDLETGAIFWQSSRDEWLCGLSLLTPEAGPLVGWDRTMHFRSWSLIDEPTESLAPSRFLFHVRPIRTYADDEILKLAMHMCDVRADTQIPGRLIASVAANQDGCVGTQTLCIDGWGVRLPHTERQRAGLALDAGIEQAAPTTDNATWLPSR